MLHCDHVALVVRELEPVVRRLGALGVEAGLIEQFPSEGTREVYLGAGGQPGRVLLLQPLGADGPYARALAKRGPGLHHLAFHTPSPETFLTEHPGWLLHSQSLESLEARHTLWLARPGVGTLVEVHRGESTYDGAPLVEQLEVPVTDPARENLVTRLSGTTVLAAGPGRLTLAGRVTELASLVR